MSAVSYAARGLSSGTPVAHGLILPTVLGTDPKCLAQAPRGHCIGVTEVIVNVTGGTMLMGLAAEELCR